MIEAKTIREVRKALKGLRSSGGKVGLVPTMGYLHDGHISLIRLAKKLAETVVVSIFVNPIQFSPSEDFEKYPRDTERDKVILEKEGVDLLFIPDSSELYGETYCTYVEVEGLSGLLCGGQRPGHFKGVATVVCKLFNIIQPEVAVFGAKDAQQVAIIGRMVRDLDFDVEIEVADTVRDPDGLAISSRNTYLSEAEREAAISIPKALFEAKNKMEFGERSAGKIRNGIIARLADAGLKHEYVCIVDPVSLEPVEDLAGKVLIALAAWSGKTRLIDNVMIEIERN